MISDGLVYLKTFSHMLCVCFSIYKFKNQINDSMMLKYVNWLFNI